MTCFTNFCSIFSSTIYCFLKVNPSTYKKWVSPSLVSNVQHIRLCQFENKRGRRFCCITAPCSWSRICSARKYCLSDCQFKPFKCTEHKENISSKKSIQKTDHCAYWAHFGRHLKVMILKMETICVFASKKMNLSEHQPKMFRSRQSVHNNKNDGIAKISNVLYSLSLRFMNGENQNTLTICTTSFFFLEQWADA